MISAKKGAETSVYLASSPDVSKTSGQYWSHKKIRKYNKLADDPEAGQKLWDLSASYADIEFMNQFEKTGNA